MGEGEVLYQRGVTQIPSAFDTESYQLASPDLAQRTGVMATTLRHPNCTPYSGMTVFFPKLVAPDESPRPAEPTLR